MNILDVYTKIRSLHKDSNWRRLHLRLMLKRKQYIDSFFAKQIYAEILSKEKNTHQIPIKNTFQILLKLQEIL